MTSKQPRDMSASVLARLMNIAKLNNEAFDLVLVRFAIERLLFRLSESQYRDHFVVKGATMFQAWSNLSHRPTRDLDLLGTGEPDVERFVEIFRDLCVQEVENDGLVFAVDSVSAKKMKEEEEYEGIRMKFDAFLGSALNSNDLTLSDITARLVVFLMPPAEAASQGKQFSKYWRPIDGWTERQ